MINRSLATTALLTTTLLLGLSASAQSTRNLVTNDNNIDANTATFFTLDPLGALTQVAVVPTGGLGRASGLVSQRGVVAQPGSPGCIYIANQGSANITGIVESTREVVGPYSGIAEDTGAISLALNGSVLYAGFGSGKIATFQIADGCTLEFLGDVTANGAPNGMRAVGGILVVAYADGYIESYNTAGTLPTFNDDRQQSTGFQVFGYRPAAVEITRDAHWAIFGDTAGRGALEVADISSGKLTPTLFYSIGNGKGSTHVTLSPDEKFLYSSSNLSQSVSAAYFDATTGVLSHGCGATLKGGVRVGGSIATAPGKQSSGAIYVAEYVNGIGTLRVQSRNGVCQLIEAANSPTLDPQSSALLSLETFLSQ